MKIVSLPNLQSQKWVDAYRGKPAYNNLCWLQEESDEARRHLYFHWSVNFYFYLGEALFAAPSFSKTMNVFICIIVLRHYHLHVGNMMA
jgi:hypothetical protein